MIIELISCKPKNKLPLSKIIQDAENVDFSHYAISYNGYIYHAKYPKLKCQTYAEFESFYQPVKKYCFNVPKGKELLVHSYLRSYIGTPYSLAQLVLIYIGIIFHGLNKRISLIKLNNKRALICSEFVAMFMKNFFGSEFNESIDTIGLREVQSMLEQLEEADQHGNIWLP